MDSTTTEAASPGTTIEVVDIARIMHAIPHRYPFLMIDRVVDMVRNHSAIGIKNVSVNESFFQGHFPNHPVMPGVLIIESMAQTAAVLVVETLGPDAAGKLVYFMSIEGAKFRRPVVPGDQLRIHVTKDRQSRQCLEVQCSRPGGRRLGGRGDLCRDDHGPRRTGLSHRCRKSAKISVETTGYGPMSKYPAIMIELVEAWQRSRNLAVWPEQLRTREPADMDAMPDTIALTGGRDL